MIKKNTQNLMYKTLRISPESKKIVLPIVYLIVFLACVSVVSGLLTDDLLCYFDFEQTGNNANLTDVHSGKHNGTIYGVNGSQDFTRGVTGVVDNAWNYSGKIYGSSPIYPHIFVNNSDEFAFGSNASFSLWFNVAPSTVSGSPFMRKRDGGNSWGITLNQGGGYRVSIYNATAAYNTDGGTFVTDEWVHLVGTVNDTNVALYLNGTMINTTVWGGSIKSSLSNISIGGDISSGFILNGTVDEVGIWNRTLTPSEVSDLYNNGNGLDYDSFVEESLTVTLNEPTDTLTFVDSSRLLNATTTPDSGVTMDNATFYVWFDSNHTLYNSTTVTMDSTSNETTFTIHGLIFETYRWNVLGCGSNSSGESVCSDATGNFTFTRNRFSEIGEFHVVNVSETNNETFQLNISLDTSATLYSASLLYNGTTFPVSEDDLVSLGGGNYSLTRVVDIPVINTTEEQKSFNWTLNLNVGVGFETESTTTYWQNVSYTNVTTAGTTIAINFSVYDEETLAPLYVDFGGTMEWYLGGGTNSKINPFDIDASHEFDFYVIPDNKTHYTDATINVVNDSANTSLAKTYKTRNFDFRKLTLDNVTEHRRLLLLNGTKGRDVIIGVKDAGLTPLEDYIVEIERYYPDENVYRVVESQRTDVFGQFQARLIEGEVRYRFRFYDENNFLVKTISNTNILCESTICKVQFVIEDDVDVFGDFDDLTDHSYNFTFNNNTNIFTFVWDDNREETSVVHRLEVKRRAFNGTSSICNETSSLTTGLLSCDVGDSRADYQGRVFRRVGTVETTLDEISVTVGSHAETFGTEGLLWSFVLLATMIIIGIFYPPVGIVLYLFGVFLLGMLDIVYINPAIIIAQIVIGVFFIWAFKG